MEHRQKGRLDQTARQRGSANSGSDRDAKDRTVEKSLREPGKAYDHLMLEPAARQQLDQSLSNVQRRSDERAWHDVVADGQVPDDEQAHRNDEVTQEP